jgi:hypothetical protein
VKKLVILGLSLGAAVQMGRMIEGISRTAAADGGQGGGGAICTSENGDVNADGKVDLSDAVTVLGHLFLGNPEQLAPLCATQGPSGLPDTGLTKCSGQNGAETPCDDASCPGQDAAHATGCSAEGRFVDFGDGTILDNCTGLTWQKDAADVSGDHQIDDADRLPWCAALAFCDNLNFAGHDDWRLPNIRELQSIVDYGRSNPSLDPVFGAPTLSAYWSSTPIADHHEYAWYVSFFGGIVDNGGVSASGKDGYLYSRAVRSGP